MLERARIRINGIVQGVGFRPFIHRLVSEYGLNGMIRNTSSGVEIALDGERAELTRLIADIPQKAPPLAVIEDIQFEFEFPEDRFEGFRIQESERGALRNTLVSPDLGICDDCLRELFTPGDRRYRYPFINCTNCGPRFTIIKDVPYDRKMTSMSVFPMCPECEREYRDIRDRRYHAQPDACPVCGPKIFFAGEDGVPYAEGEHALTEAKRLLSDGKIVAVKGLGGFHLACRTDRPDFAMTLRRRKHRDEKPFAVMFRNTECIRTYCEMTDAEEKILTSFHRPIVLLQIKEGAADELRALSDNRRLGVMLPYTPLHYLLFEGSFDALVMTSANLSERPVLSGDEEATEELRGIADGFLLHNREILTKCDDSVCTVLNGQEYFFRRSRGYVPYPVRYAGFAHKILACGAEQKANFCLTKEGYAFPSQHIGDLKNMETLRHYEEQIRHFERLFDMMPEAVVCDLHPDYLSTETAERISSEAGIPLLRVQHHHAHMASCMADNGLEGDVIGLIWDGTGLGTDGTSWGGECLAGGYENFERTGSIRPIPLIGGDRAMKELDRVAYALLKAAGCDTGVVQKAEDYGRIHSTGLNCPLSSGMGRLFDGVSAILGIRKTAGYEGQGAILLEAAAENDETGLLPCSLTEENGLLLFDWRETVRALDEEVKKGTAVGKLTARFMNTLMDMAVRQCIFTREKTGLSRVVLSGGSFQNMYMMSRLPGKLEQAGFEVYCHRQTACNDEGIALGQAAVAEALLTSR